MTLLSLVGTNRVAWRSQVGVGCLASSPLLSSFAIPFLSAHSTFIYLFSCQLPIILPAALIFAINYFLQGPCSAVFCVCICMHVCLWVHVCVLCMCVTHMQRDVLGHCKWCLPGNWASSLERGSLKLGTQCNRLYQMVVGVWCVVLGIKLWNSHVF